MSPLPPASSSRRDGRGSAIITVLVLAGVTALIASSLLFRASQEAKLATRSGYIIAAVHLAEAGLEEGMHALSSSGVTTANSWSSISGMTSCSSKVITGLSVSGATGEIYIRVDQSTSTAPVIIAAGVITIRNQPKIVKQLRLTTSMRSTVTGGLVSKTSITFTENVDLDSYNSSLGAYNAATNRSDLITVGALSTSSTAVSLSNKTDIYGYVATAGSQPTVSNGGRIYGSTTPSGTLIDSSRVRTDFSSNLTTPTAPTSGVYTLSEISNSTYLPRLTIPMDTAGSNGRYVYKTSKVDLSGTDTITIWGPVDLVVTGDYKDKDTSGFNLNNYTWTGITSLVPSLSLYLGADATFEGKAVQQSTAVDLPSKVTIYGTSTSQKLTFKPKSDVYAVINAPNATLSYDISSTDFFGAITAKSISIKGPSTKTGGVGEIHYDIQLSTGTAGSGSTGSGTLAPAQWVELSDRPGSGTTFARDNGAPFQNLF